MISHPIFRSLERVYRPFSSTLLSFSGGVDSTVLFFLLWNLRKKRADFSFEVFFLNHKMPGNEEYGNRAALWVQNICEKFDVPCHLWEAKKSSYEKSQRSLEELGRDFRYRALREIVREKKLQTITTGHHRDDLVETVLMRLFQGVSPSRLCGMKVVQGTLLRPLLPFSKKQLSELAREFRWVYLEDPSNAQLIYKRNRLRNGLIPRIREQFPVFDRKIVEFLTLLEEQNQEWKKNLPDWRKEPGKLRIRRTVLEACSPYAQKESIKRAILDLDPSHFLTYRQLEFLHGYLERYQDCYNGEKILYQKGNIRLTKQKMDYVCELGDWKKFAQV